MAIYIYLRVSTGTQDTHNQLHGIRQYCQERGIEPDAIVEDTASGEPMINSSRVMRESPDLSKRVNWLLASSKSPRATDASDFFSSGWNFCCGEVSTSSFGI